MMPEYIECETAIEYLAKTFRLQPQTVKKLLKKFLLLTFDITPMVMHDMQMMMKQNNCVVGVKKMGIILLMVVLLV